MGRDQIWARAERNKEWETRIADFQSSGQTLSTWCTMHNLKAQQVRYWMQKLRSNHQPVAKPAKCLSVEISHPQPETPLQVKVGTATIEVHPGFNTELFLDVVRTLLNELKGQKVYLACGSTDMRNYANSLIMGTKAKINRLSLDSVLQSFP